jgi:hypothetical protein
MNLKDSGRGSQLPQLSFVVLTQSLRGRQPPHADTGDANNAACTNPMASTNNASFINPMASADSLNEIVR